MRYFGGKGRTGTEIAGYLNAIRKAGQTYWEPFVGGGWVLSHIRGDGDHFASDKHFALVNMWQALSKGWVPPEVVTAEDYEGAKMLPDTDPRKAFVGFGCSFGGKYFGGYARSGKRNYASNAKNSLAKKIASMPETTFFCADFLRAPGADKHMLIYCDPPYNNTTGYSTGDFDTEAFYERCRDLAYRGHTVVISEYAAPDDFSCVLEIPTKTDIRNADGEKEKRVERLFVPGDVPQLQPQLF